VRISYSEDELVNNLKQGIAAPGVDCTALLKEFGENKEAIGNDSLLWMQYRLRCDAKRLAFGVCDDKAWLDYLKSARMRVQ